MSSLGAQTPQANGTVKHLPFHNYTMKQAIEEGFIMDVLTNYTPDRQVLQPGQEHQRRSLSSTRRECRAKLRRYVENHEYAIAQKAAIIVDHFNDSVFMPKKMGGEARAMVVVDGVDRAIRYYHAIRDLISRERIDVQAPRSILGIPEGR